MSPKKLNLFLSIGLLIGYVWIGLHSIRIQKEDSQVYSTCLIKNITSYPCPACGSSRSVLSLVEGNFKQAIYYNPFGLLMAGLMLVLPFWMLYDFVKKRQTLYRTYLNMETLFKRRSIMILFATIVIANWIWNIYKGI